MCSYVFDDLLLQSREPSFFISSVLYNSVKISLFILQGWTLYEVLRYAPEHNWVAYEEALKTHPVLSKMAISGVVYSLGDWIAQVSILLLLFICFVLCDILSGCLCLEIFQCYEGKPLFEFDRTRMFRSGLVGFTLHGSLSHYYYQFCEVMFVV